MPLRHLRLWIQTLNFRVLFPFLCLQCEVFLGTDPAQRIATQNIVLPWMFVVELRFGDRKPVLQSGVAFLEALAGACQVHPREPGIRGG